MLNNMLLLIYVNNNQKFYFTADESEEKTKVKSACEQVPKGNYINSLALCARDVYKRNTKTKPKRLN